METLQVQITNNMWNEHLIDNGIFTRGSSEDQIQRIHTQQTKYIPNKQPLWLDSTDSGLILETQF